MKCITFAFKQLIRHGGYVNVRFSYNEKGRLNPWVFHFLWSKGLVGVRHMTTDDPKRHWFKEILCALTGTHYIEKNED